MIDSQRDIGRTSVDMGEVLRDISFPNADLDSLDVSFPDSGSAPQSRAQQKDLFAVQKRKSWDKSTEARCDFSYRLRLTRRSDINFISIWQKTVYGRTLTDIKGDPDMVDTKSRTLRRSSARNWGKCWRYRSTRMWHFATQNNV